MTLSSQIIPAVILLIANLMSGKQTSFRWEVVTAVFGWAAGISLLAYCVTLFIEPEGAAKDYIFQMAALC